MKYTCYLPLFAKSAHPGVTPYKAKPVEITPDAEFRSGIFSLGYALKAFMDNRMTETFRARFEQESPFYAWIKKGPMRLSR